MTASTQVDREFAAFRSMRRFPALDGLRALSIVMVLTVHMHDPFAWGFFDGSLGVTLFFCISGFLITTLLLREEEKNGRVSLKSFYIRRVFRILPLYFLALGLASVLVLGFGLGQGGGNFLDRLPLLATFNGEFAGTGTFSHSWSLGIEEKFYILWPLLAFGVAFIRSRIALILAVVVPLAFMASFAEPVAYFGIYMPILGGCALAVAMHYQRSFRYVYLLAHPALAALFFLLMLAMTAWNRHIPWHEAVGDAHVWFAVSVLLAMPGTIIRSGWTRSILSVRPVVYYGNLAYGIYLFHPFIGEVIDKVIPAGGDSWAGIGVRFIAMFVLSFALAWILKRTIEDPMISLGRRLASGRRPDGTSSASSSRGGTPSSQPDPQESRRRRSSVFLRR